MKTRAAVLRETGAAPPYRDSRPLSVVEIDLAEPGPGEVLVRISSAGLCHSDIARIDGSRPRPTPMVLGHEAAGVVEATGPGVTRVVAGDNVVLTYISECGVCEYCSSGRPPLCVPGSEANARGCIMTGSIPFSERGYAIYTHSGVSAFSGRTVVAQESVVPVPAGTPMHVAAVFGCAALTGVGAVLNAAKAERGSTIAIFGAGGVGLMALLGARVAGAAQIVVVEPNATKRASARELGATRTIDPSAEDPVAIIKREISGGVTHAIDAVGLPQTLVQSVQSTRRGGTAVAVGLAPPGVAAPIPQNELVADGKTIVGSYMGSTIPARDIPRYVALWRSGLLPVERLVSSTFPLERINEALDELLEGNALRQICVFEGR